MRRKRISRLKVRKRLTPRNNIEIDRSKSINKIILIPLIASIIGGLVGGGSSAFFRKKIDDNDFQLKSSFVTVVYNEDSASIRLAHLNNSTKNEFIFDQQLVIAQDKEKYYPENITISNEESVELKPKSLTYESLDFSLDLKNIQGINKLKPNKKYPLVVDIWYLHDFEEHRVARDQIGTISLNDSLKANFEFTRKILDYNRIWFSIKDTIYVPSRVK